ncbi:MAG: 6,7-dimethyl-8-ribityllumazine synthase [Bacteroidota bacterium]|jgi:6,7-dimethyl-8-ribityllumazine synthase
MSSKDKNLSDVSTDGISEKKLRKYRIALIKSNWNDDITGALERGCRDYLTQYGANEKQIKSFHVPGSFELVYAAAHLLEEKSFDAIICIGCIIKGDTPHFDYISQAVSIGLAQLNAKGQTPIIFGILTTDNKQQALDRAGGKHGNKGVEAAATALQMIQFAHNS